ncbi:Aldehyde dehydrogenase N-terminal [Penicillium robsamsonii]|uniref:Aldehyde dehydrogenase N-terminal n=1 Tax=Penicillium robsamsonii TaxID=1792511 RepID=UPI002546C2E8|nr:Aldehyde dehydrogenase N-terminal [Penicillium robsamsonii]KAJ5817187.1 Aldehyde dehydrogenase N-terminal [Penicillium robsamsonii]
MITAVTICGIVCTFDLISPTTNEKFAKVYEATEDDKNTAVAVAKAAFPPWSALSPLPGEVGFLILESHEELAQPEAVSMGRPVPGYFDPCAAAITFNFFAENGYQAL